MKRVFLIRNRASCDESSWTLSHSIVMFGVDGRFHFPHLNQKLPRRLSRYRVINSKVGARFLKPLTISLRADSSSMFITNSSHFPPFEVAALSLLQYACKGFYLRTNPTSLFVQSAQICAKK
ncbi:hypothetical protein ACOME3_002238 [Neoechinorhynchus agilis]